MGQRVQRTISLSVKENEKVDEVLKTKKISLVDIFRIGLEKAYCLLIKNDKS
jgi:hypothetical protein